LGTAGLSAFYSLCDASFKLRIEGDIHDMFLA
jgi:hypothetical protein